MNSHCRSAPDPGDPVGVEVDADAVDDATPEAGFARRRRASVGGQDMNHCGFCRTDDHGSEAHTDLRAALRVADRHAGRGDIIRSKLWGRVAVRLALMQIGGEVVVFDDSQPWMMLSELSSELRARAAPAGGLDRLQLARDFSRLARFELDVVGSRESVAIRAFLSALEAAL